MKAIIILLACLVLLTGCTTSIEDIKENPDEFMGETVTVRGEVSNVIKIGKLSGFTLTDIEGDKISVSSEELPKEGDTVSVKGVVMKEVLVGNYIHAKDIR